MKTRIDKSYLQLLGKQQITKEDIFKQKIDVNRILDEVVNSGLKWMYSLEVWFIYFKSLYCYVS